MRVFFFHAQDQDNDHWLKRDKTNDGIVILSIFLFVCCFFLSRFVSTLLSVAPSTLSSLSLPSLSLRHSFSLLPFLILSLAFSPLQNRNVKHRAIVLAYVNIVFESSRKLRVMSHHADFSTDFHVRSCYSVVPLTRSLTFLRFSRRHQQLFHPIVALSYSSCLTVRARERERERK